MFDEHSLPIQQIAQILTSWFQQNMRPLPWRKNYTAYSVWVSEIMLQQTQVSTVLPYFNKFLRRFPDLKALSATQDEELLKFWEGLGYYRRGLNMLSAAKQIMKLHQGHFPNNKKQLKALPGIGNYTAGAILSMAFNQPAAVVDGNVIRVFSRLLDWKQDVSQANSLRYFEQISLNLAQAGTPRVLQQAVMELGATICTKAPLCNLCPLNKACLAYQNNTQKQRPVKPARPKTTPLFTSYLVLKHQQQFLLQQQPKNAWWAGMWVFPFVSAEKPCLAQQKLKSLSQQAGLNNFSIPQEPCLSFKHHVTRYKIDAKIYFYTAQNTKLPFANSAWFTLEQLTTLSMPKASALIREQLHQLHQSQKN